MLNRFRLFFVLCFLASPLTAYPMIKGNHPAGAFTKGAAAQSFSPVVFVPEISTHVRDFSKEGADKIVAAVSISSCHLLEISNQDDQGRRTVFSLTHFLEGQLAEGDQNRSLRLVWNLKQVLKDFLEAGGDLKTAKIVIRGGHELNRARREFLRQNLKNDLNGLLTHIEREPIEEPLQDALDGPSATVDYAFLSDKTYIVKSLSQEKLGTDWQDLFFPEGTEPFWDNEIDPHNKGLTNRNYRAMIFWQTQHPDLPLFHIGPTNEIDSNVEVSMTTIRAEFDNFENTKTIRCSQCGKTGQLKHCSRCKKTHYCNETCQKAHWKEHKKKCVTGNLIKN